jgi:hypothetical protein
LGCAALSIALREREVERGLLFVALVLVLLAQTKKFPEYFDVAPKPERAGRRCPARSSSAIERKLADAGCSLCLAGCPRE